MKIAFLIYQYFDNEINYQVSKTSIPVGSWQLAVGKKNTILNPSFQLAVGSWQLANTSIQHPASSIQHPQSAGGVERYVSDLSKAFVEMGHEVHIFCHKLKGTSNKSIIFHHVPAIGFWSPLKIWSFAVISVLMLKDRQGEFDIIHSFGKTLFQDVLRIGGGSHLDYMKRTYPSMKNPFLRPFIILNPRHIFNLLLEWVIFRFAKVKRIVCNSKMCKDEFLHLYHIPSNDIDVIYNGVDSRKFSPVNKKESRERLIGRTNLRSKTKSENDLFILFVGSGFKRKGLKYAVGSLPLLDPGLSAHLIIAGKGRFEGYKRQAENLGVSDRIIYLGVTDNVRELYDACDIFLFPTEYDAFPNVCLEAMAMELPVIVSRSCGAAEIIDDNVDGFVIDYPVEPEDIAQRIRLLADEQIRVKIGRLAREKALNYSVQSNAEKTLKLYEKICAERQAN